MTTVNVVTGLNGRMEKRRIVKRIALCGVPGFAIVKAGRFYEVVHIVSGLGVHDGKGPTEKTPHKSLTKADALARATAREAHQPTRAFLRKAIRKAPERLAAYAEGMWP